MAVTLFPDGVPCALQEAFDLSFLRQWGKVFRVFDQQDSGNLCFGLEDETHRYFVKFAGARPVRYKGEPERAVELLKQSGRVYRDLAHPVLLPLLWEGPVEGGYALLFPWTEAICMGKQYPSRERFLALPLDTKLGIYREVLAFHSHVAKQGYVSVDFYDGCVLFEEATGRTLLCDVDAYHRLPFFNPVGRMWGSTRFMAPEEFEKGAAIDESTMVHTLGAFAFELFAPEGRELAQWPLSPAAWACAKKSGLSQTGGPLFGCGVVYTGMGRCHRDAARSPLNMKKPLDNSKEETAATGNSLFLYGVWGPSPPQGGLGPGPGGAGRHQLARLPGEGGVLLPQVSLGRGHGAAAGGGKGHHRFAGEVAAFQEGVHGPGLYPPPDGEAHKDGVVLLYVLHGSGQGGTAGGVPHLQRAAALLVGPVQVGGSVGLGRGDFVQVAAHCRGDGLGGPGGDAAGGKIGH